MRSIKSRLSRVDRALRRSFMELHRHRKRERAEEQLRVSHGELRALTNYLQKVREEERTRIALQVHDDLGQALTGLKLDLSWIAGKIPREREVLRKIKTMSEHIDETINTVRRIATELRPGVLDSLGLVAAIEWQAADFQRRTGIPCEVRSEVPEAPFFPEFTTVCFRIFQETLTNIIRHANATRVEVLFLREQDQIALIVRDDGCGISEKAINTPSIGLLGMKERAAQIGGALDFYGRPGLGTTVILRVPVSSAVPEETKNGGPS